MASVSFEKQRFFDREEQHREFARLVSLEETTRLLLVQAQKDQGKSELLRSFHYSCLHEREPSVPVSLVPLEQLTDASPIALAALIADQLAEAGIVLERFSALYAARVARDAIPFSGLAGIHGEMHAEGASVTGAAGGVIVQGGVHYHGEAPAWSPALDHEALKRCLAAFFEDLRAVGAKGPVVLLLDSWEECDENLRTWIAQRLTGGEGFGLLAPPSPVVVIASRERAGLGWLEEPKYSGMIRTSPIPPWEPEQVGQLLAVAGFPDVSEAEIEVAATWLARGTGLGQVLAALRMVRVGSS